jgi:hypothetical protein
VTKAGINVEHGSLAVCAPQWEATTAAYSTPIECQQVFRNLQNIPKAIPQAAVRCVGQGPVGLVTTPHPS